MLRDWNKTTSMWWGLFSVTAGVCDGHNNESIDEIHSIWVPCTNLQELLRASQMHDCSNFHTFQTTGRSNAGYDNNNDFDVDYNSLDCISIWVWIADMDPFQETPHTAARWCQSPLIQYFNFEQSTTTTMPPGLQLDFKPEFDVRHIFRLRTLVWGCHCHFWTAIWIAIWIAM